MSKVTMLLATSVGFLTVAGPAHAQTEREVLDYARPYQITVDGYLPDAYGPDVHADRTGRPFVWVPVHGNAPVLEPVTEEVFGPRLGMDAAGRPVRPSCPPGWSGPC